MNAPISRIRELKEAANRAEGFQEKALAVFKAKGFSEADIEEAKQMIRDSWADIKDLWINWINDEFARGWR